MFIILLLPQINTLRPHTRCLPTESINMQTQ